MKDKSLSHLVVRNILFNIAGCFCYAAGINCFAAPHNIAPGGASGIAILLNYLFGMPIGIFVFLFNIPLLIWMIAKKYFDRIFVCKVLASTALLSVMTDLVVARLPVYKGDPLLASMFAGALMGFGLAAVHLGESNTGGISLLGLIIQKIKPEFQVGTLISFFNFLIVLASGVIYRNIETVLYAIVVVYISGLIMDSVLANAGTYHLLLVISDWPELVKRPLLDSHCGVTVLNGQGGYTGGARNVLLCVVGKNDCARLQKCIWMIDRQALTVVLNSDKVHGKGFRSIM